MKRVVVLSILLFTVLSVNVQAQFYDPVEWSYKTNDLGKGEVELIFVATVEDNWHIYSQFMDEGGPIATNFMFTETPNYKLIGKVEERGELIAEYDENFQMDVKYYGGSVQFVQKIKVLTNKDFKLIAEAEYMACDDKQCTPPNYADAEFKVKGFTGAKINKVDDAEPTGQIDEDGLPDETLEIDYTKARPDNADEEIVEEDHAKTIASSHTSSSVNDSEDESLTLWVIFGLGFAGGLAAFFMPCIFPMIPLTVSFFTKQSKSKGEGIRKALLYGVSIIVIYVAMGVIVTLSFGENALSDLAADPWFNLVFFVMFVVFALSFLGAFEITLPSKWVNKADEASNKGGVVGIFFMAFTLALVSFSCTGPIIGTLLFDAARNGEIMGPAVGMLGFSTALAIPFILFAAFPGWLNSLPKSGGWLNMVKVSLGFIELAAALKFLSNADMVWQLGILKRELFIAAWVSIFGLLTIYLLGGFRMPHDSPSEKVSIPRMSFAIVFLIFTMYLLPGMFGAPVKAVSAFVPPDFYAEKRIEVANLPQATLNEGEPTPQDYGSHPEDCPLGLSCFHEYEEGLAYAKKVNKPILLDFTGWTCTNCRQVENNVWSKPEVFNEISQEFVLISLYTDERDRLPEEEQYVSEITGKKVRTLGNKRKEFQVEHFQTNALPYYVIVDHELNEMIDPTAFTQDAVYYKGWLDKGKKEFYKRQGK